MKPSPEQAVRRASAALFDSLTSSKNSLRRRNAEALKLVCDQMERDGVRLTIAEVVRRCNPDGPKFSTVSNKGSSLGEYVRLRITEQVASLPHSKGPGVTRVSELVHDSVLQARVRDLEETAKHVSRENVALRGLLKNLRPGVKIDDALSVGPASDGSLALVTAQLSPSPSPQSQVAAALLKLLDHLIRDRQYLIYRGRLTINSKAILSPTDLEAIRQATGLVESDWQSRYRSAE